MNNEEKLLFEKILDLIKIPEPDDTIKQKIIKVVFLLMIVKEIAVFNLSIPGIFMDDENID